MVVWTGQDDLSAGDYSYGGVFARRYDADGNGGPEFQVNTYVDGLQGGQKVAAIFPGYFVVVWTDYGQYNYGRVLGKIYDPFDLVVAEGPIGTVDGSRRPAVGAGGGSGEFVVVWSRYATGWDVFGKRFSFGTLLTPEFRANAGSAGSQDEAAVAVLSNGDFVVTWQDTRLSGYQFVSSVRGQRLQANGTWAGGDFQVNGSAVEVPQRPAVAASANAAGGFVVAWTSNSEGSGAGVSARHFAPVAPGEPFRVNSYTTGAQRAPSISFTGTDRFVVAWASSGQDGSEYGVFGRRYSTDVSLDVIFKDCFSPGCP
jgi:hypothetical protein